MNRRGWLIVALVLPILALGTSAWLKSIQRASGVEVILPIEGFDPRDLLSGHYLTYRVDYGVEGCPSDNGQASICLRPRRGIYAEGELPADCTLFIHGQCENNLFNAGIERFYIPEEDSTMLEEKVRQNKGEIVLSVDTDGNAAIRDLLIEGKAWREQQP